MYNALKLASAGIAAVMIAATAIADDRDWVEKSDEHAQIVLAAMAEFSPEGAGSLGVDGLDENVSDLGPGIHERELDSSRKVLAELEQRLSAESDRKVRQDLGILIQAVTDNIRISSFRSSSETTMVAGSTPMIPMKPEPGR